MVRSNTLVSALLLGLCASTGAFADDNLATVAEAGERLKALVAITKAKGAAAAAQAVMGADDPLKCKYKDLSCLLITMDNGTFVINTAIPKLVGQQFPRDLVDVEGSPIIAAQLDPGRQGKLKWDAKFKFARPDTKKVVPRWSFCERVGDTHVACVVISQQ